MDINYNCYVIRIVDENQWSPPRTSVYLITDLGAVFVTSFDQGTPIAVVLAAILAFVQTLPPCPV